MRKYNKFGELNRRNCKCKECGENFLLDPLDDICCPKCKTLHCPDCLKSCKNIKTTSHYFESGSHYGTSVSGDCPNCGYPVIDYDYQ
jgi:hypothetical protein